jgi:8-oxo-dGTP pyrophosphatase MutT (NUDIX family)
LWSLARNKRGLIEGRGRGVRCLNRTLRFRLVSQANRGHHHRMVKSDRSGDTQFAALPYSISQRGAVHVMLLTSRDTGRWVIPKGWPMVEHKPHKVAATEAMQEAGVVGIIWKKAIGSYHYTKLLPDGEDRLCEVVVFPLRVTQEATTWREQAQRQRAWFPRDAAASLVDEGGLALIISRFRPDHGLPLIAAAARGAGPVIAAS